MRTHRDPATVPLWKSDARLRRLIAGNVRRRRAERRRELQRIESEIRAAEQGGAKNRIEG